jgi:hypothetical protein
MLSRERLTHSPANYGPIRVIPEGGEPIPVVEAGKNSPHDQHSTEYPYLVSTEVSSQGGIYLRASVEDHVEHGMNGHAAHVHGQLIKDGEPLGEPINIYLKDGESYERSKFTISHEEPLR